MLVWRIARRPFRALDGEGARIAGGRWNSEGRPVVYASGSLALAALEYLVHVDPALVPDDLIALGIELPRGATSASVEPAVLPADWNRFPDHPACQNVGNEWIERGRALTLRVPSVLVPEEENVLINPKHKQAGGLQVTRERRFVFDPRLL
jgi:RES domain-containing protein